MVTKMEACFTMEDRLMKKIILVIILAIFFCGCKDIIQPEKVKSNNEKITQEEYDTLDMPPAPPYIDGNKNKGEL